MSIKIRAVATDDGFEIIGNREGLLALAQTCQSLAGLPDDPAESRRQGNHYHFAPWMNNTGEDSVRFLIMYRREL